MANHKKEVHVYFPKEVFEGLQKLAAANRRSMTAEVILAVEEKLAKKEKSSVKKTT